LGGRRCFCIHMKLCNWYEFFLHYLSIKYRSHDYYFFISNDLYCSMHCMHRSTWCQAHHCQFLYKTDSDRVTSLSVSLQNRQWCTPSVSVFLKPIVMCLPTYKKKPGTYTHAPSLHSHFSVLRTLTSRSFHSTWSWLLDISLQVYICSPLSHCSYVYMHRRSIFI